MTDDIVTRLRGRAIVLFSNGADGNAFIDEQAADEIERLRELADNLAHHLQGYVCHCNMSKCKCGYDDVMDEYKAVRGE